MRETQDETGALIEHIAVQSIRAQQRDPVLQPLSSHPRGVQFRLYPVDSLTQLAPSRKAAITLNGVIPDVGDGRDAQQRQHAMAKPPGQFARGGHGSTESQVILLCQENSLRVCDLAGGIDIQNHESHVSCATVPVT